MKIKIPKPPLTKAQKDSWSQATGYFREYLNECEQAGVDYEMVLQATADALAYLLVRHSNNTQAIMSIMNMTIAKQAHSLREGRTKAAKQALRGGDK